MCNTTIVHSQRELRRHLTLGHGPSEEALSRRLAPRPARGAIARPEITIPRYFRRGIRRQMRPTSARIKRTTRINPTVPLGTYPQFRLWPQVGSTPTSIRIRITSKIVPIATSFASGLFQFQIMPRPGVASVSKPHASGRELLLREFVHGPIDALPGLLDRSLAGQRVPRLVDPLAGFFGRSLLAGCQRDAKPQRDDSQLLVHGRSSDHVMTTGMAETRCSPR